MNCLSQLQTLNEFSSIIKKEEEILAKRNARIRDLLVYQLEVFQGKQKSNSAALIEQYRVQVQIEQLEIEELNRSLDRFKQQREQSLAGSLQSLREFVDSNFKEVVVREEDVMEFFALYDAGISYVDSLSSELGGEWPFRVQLIRKLFDEKVQKYFEHSIRPLRDIREYGSALFAKFDKFIKEGRDEIDTLESSLSVIPYQRYQIDLEDLPKWEKEVHDKRRALRELTEKLVKSCPKSVCSSVEELRESFVIRYSIFKNIDCEFDSEGIEELAGFCFKRGNLYERLIRKFNERNDFLEKIKADYDKDKLLLTECIEHLKSGEIRDSDNSWSQLSHRFSTLNYSAVSKEIANFKYVLHEIERIGESMLQVGVEPSFLQLTFSKNRESAKVSNVEGSLTSILKKIENLPPCLFRDKLENEAREHLRYLNSREGVQKESRFVARFAVILLFFGLIAVGGYFGYHFYQKSPSEVHGITLDEKFAQNVQVIVAGDIIDPEKMEGTMKVRYPLPGKSELVVFRTLDRGDITLDVNLHNADFIDMTDDVLGVINDKQRTDVQGLLDQSLNDYVSVKDEYQRSGVLLSRLQSRMERARTSLAKYYEKYPNFTEEVRDSLEEEVSKTKSSLQKSLENHQANREALNQELDLIADEAIQVTNEYILQNLLLVPILKEEDKASIFVTDFFQQGAGVAIVTSGEDNDFRDKLIVERYFSDNSDKPVQGSISRKEHFIFLKNFPTEIRDKELRQKVKELYTNWREKKRDYEGREFTIKSQIEKLDQDLASKIKEFEEFDKIIEPLRKEIEELAKLIPQEEMRVATLKQKMEQLDTSVSSLTNKIGNRPDGLLLD